MKRTVLAMLAVAVAVFGIVAISSAQCADALQDGLEANVAAAQVGDTIEYTVTLWIDPSGNPCTLYHTTVYFHPPPDVQNAPCVDYQSATPLNTTPITVTPGTLITWTSADYPILSQPVIADWAGATAWAYTCTRYVPDLAGANPDMPDPLSPLWSRDSAQTGVVIDCPEPCIEITKEVDCDKSKVGDTVTYSICIENCGDDFDLADIAVYDDQLAAQYGSPLPGFPTTLTPGQEFCLDFDYEILSGDDNGLEYPAATVVNQAYVMATDVCSGEPLETTYSGEVTVYLVHPGISVEKTCYETEPVQPGDPATFEVVITNDGDIPLDVMTNGGISPFTLDEFSSQTFYETVDCGSDPTVSNSITVTATIPDEFCLLPNEYEDTDTAECACGECSIECTKTANPMVSKAGHDVYFEVCVENTGTNCELELISVVDDLMGDISGEFSSILVDDGYDCFGYTYPIPDGTPSPLVNTVTFTYMGADGLEYECTETVEVEILHPDFDVVVECTTDPVPEGSDGSFDVTITNTGDVDLVITTDWAMLLGPYTLTVGESFTDIATAPCEGSEACFGINVHAELPDTYQLDNYYDEYAEDCCPCPGLEGCTPGYWGHGGADCWCDSYTHGQLVSSVFDVPSSLMSSIGSETLLEAVTTPGGGGSVKGRANQLVFHGVAALLNACSDDVAYPMGVVGVIDFVNEALATLDAGEIGAAKSTLDMYNNLGCSIDAHCRPIEDDEPGDKVLDANTGEISNPALHKGVVPTKVWSQPLPNPFAGTTTINFGLPKSGEVAIDVYDVAGRHVSTVVNAEKSAGTHEAAWNGRDSSGVQVPAGVYFYRFSFDSETLMKKMIVMK